MENKLFQKTKRKEEKKKKKKKDIKNNNCNECSLKHTKTFIYSCKEI